MRNTKSVVSPPPFRVSRRKKGAFLFLIIIIVLNVSYAFTTLRNITFKAIPFDCYSFKTRKEKNETSSKILLQDRRIARGRAAVKHTVMISYGKEEEKRYFRTNYTAL